MARATPLALRLDLVATLSGPNTAQRRRRHNPRTDRRLGRRLGLHLSLRPNRLMGRPMGSHRRLLRFGCKRGV